MVFNNENLLENIEETEEEKEEREKQERKEHKQKKRRDIIEFIVYITLSLILIYCIFNHTKHNKTGVQVGGLAPLAVVGKIMSSVAKVASKVISKTAKVVTKGAKAVGKGLMKVGKYAAKGLYHATDLVGSSLNIGSSFKSSNYNSGSYSKSISNIKDSGSSKILLTLVIGGFACLFAFMIPTLLPLFLLFVILLICKTFAIEQIKEMMD